MSPDPLLAVRGLRKRMRRAGSLRSASEDVEVLRGVDLDVEEGGIQAVVGASGAGKTTLAFAALGLLRPDAGTVLFEGRDLGVLPASALRALRPRLQAVFQDPWGSLTPHRSLRALLVEPLEVHGIARGREAEARAARALDEVGLDRALLAVKPGSLSGGQRQRAALARALALEPRLLVCDEPTGALDLSEQARILALLARRRAERGLACLFVTHDLAVARQIADRVAVMDEGRIVEEGPTSAVLEVPRHPATRALLAGGWRGVGGGRP